jgi:acyl-CoA dehydrogenase
MYLASMVLKHYENQGRQDADLPLVEWACRSLLYKAQEQLHSFLRNFPNRFLAGFMRLFIFPRGQTYHAPSDPLSHQLVDEVLHATVTRDRLTDGIYRTVEPTNPLGLLQEALVLADAAEPLEKRVRVEGVKTGRVTALDMPGQIQQSLAAGIITETEAAMLRDYDRRVMEIIHVDDFTTDEMAAGEQPVDVRPARVSNA